MQVLKFRKYIFQWNEVVKINKTEKSKKIKSVKTQSKTSINNIYQT